jgi:hypothetical protein
MDQQEVHLRRNITATREAIDKKLEMLENRLEDTLEARIVKLKSTTDSIAQMGHDPWVMFGSAILMGYAMSSFNRGILAARCHTSIKIEESH